MKALNYASLALAIVLLALLNSSAAYADVLPIEWRTLEDVEITSQKGDGALLHQLKSDGYNICHINSCEDLLRHDRRGNWTRLNSVESEPNAFDTFKPSDATAVPQEIEREFATFNPQFNLDAVSGYLTINAQGKVVSSKGTPRSAITSNFYPLALVRDSVAHRYWIVFVDYQLNHIKTERQARGNKNHIYNIVWKSLILFPADALINKH